MQSKFWSTLLAIQASTAAPAFAEQTDAPAPEKPSKVKVEVIAAGLENPWSLAFLPDGRMLVTERPGRMRIVTKDGKKSAPLKNVPDVYAHGQGGLLDVVLAPDFAVSNKIFFSYAEWRDNGRKNGTSVDVGKLVLEGDGGRIDEGATIFQQQPAFDSGAHFGSRIVLARDGTLFVTTGDRYTQRNQAQNPGNHIGKVIRINQDGSAPADNPKLQGWAGEVWSIGHRNIQGATLNPATGELWTVEHGAQGGDEVNRPEKGKNYGWPVISYGVNYGGSKIGEGTQKAGMEQPIYYWDPSIAPSGMTFYSGDLMPEWKGNLFVGALAGTHLARLVLDGNKVVAEEKLLANLSERIRDVRQGPDGALWLLTDSDDGKLLRVTTEK